LRHSEIGLSPPSGQSGAVRGGYALDALNFFLADVGGGIGPYLAVYLLTVRHWNVAEIGIVMSIGGIAGIVAQTPAGALIDATRAKRAVIAVAALVVTLCSLALPFWSGFWFVASSQAAIGAAGAVFGPAIAAVSLGMVGHDRFAERNGRNQAMNHGGNVVAALITGAAAYVWGAGAVFVLLAVLAALSLASVLAIPAASIDHDRARGLRDGEPDGDKGPAGLGILLTCRPLLVFAVCVFLFHLANAAMLPLVGQKLASADKAAGISLMSACIAGAQLVMVPMAILAGRKADSWGRKPLFLAGFAVLAIRGVLYTMSDDRSWLVAVQLLDGVGAGLFGVLFPLIVSDLMQGTGRFNLALGVVGTFQGIGASLSTALAGVIAVSAGYSAAFLCLAGLAATGFVIFAIMMPETRGAPAPRLAPVDSK
jgi:predicted MFS family arabinose efflux permease